MPSMRSIFRSVTMQSNSLRRISSRASSPFAATSTS